MKQGGVGITPFVCYITKNYKKVGILCIYLEAVISEYSMRNTRPII